MKYLICMLFLLVVFFLFLVLRIPVLFTPVHSPMITIEGESFSLLLAKTANDQEKGLGYRRFLPEDQGMLFPLQQPSLAPFWMKGMEFPLDIIYIRNHRIIALYQNLQNPTRQQPQTPIITPPQPANEVLEINAGLSQKYHFKIGDIVSIDL